VVGRGREQDHGERSVITPKDVEADVPEVTARVEDRRVEMRDAVDELEVAAVVDGSRVGRFAGRPRPPGWTAIATESVDHEVPANEIPLIDCDTHRTRRSVLARQQPRHSDAGSDVDRRVRRCCAPERPLDDRSPDPEIDQLLIARHARSPKLRRKVLRIRSGAHERLEDVRGPL
jgi:hypothetical protein